jgi:glycosyltransferase involved in cell wall biosynthesis
VPPDDDWMLAKAIDRMMRDDALRDLFGKAAHRRSLRYSVQAMATAYLSLYDEMTGNAQARPQLAEVG